jgi:hypothetical protein
MADEPDPAQFYLPQEESEQIFDTQIRPSALLQGGTPQQSPVAVFVLGQPGVGKSTTIKSVLDHLRQRGEAIELSGDPFKPYHPQWKTFDQTVAGANTAADGRRWRNMAQDYLMNRKVDLVIETAGRNPSEFDDLAAKAKASGYRVEAVFLAAPDAMSRAGILDRFEDMRQQYGKGRMVTPQMHESSYTGVQAAAQRIDANQAQVDAVHILRRGNLVVYSNERDASGNWVRPPQASQALAAERACWTPDEAQQFGEVMTRLRGNPAMEPWKSELQQIQDRADHLTIRQRGTGQQADLVGATRLAGMAFPQRAADTSRSANPPSTGQPHRPPPTRDKGQDLGR